MTPYHYTHNSPINRFDPDGKDDFGTCFLSTKEQKQLWNNYERVNREVGRKNEAIVYTELLPTVLDPMSSTLTVAGSYPSPLSGPLLAAGAGVKVISMGSKLTHYSLTSNLNKGDMVGDFVGLGLGAVTKPIGGEIADRTIDLMIENISNKKVNNKYKIHQQSRIKSSLLRSVALGIGLIDSHSPLEKMNTNENNDDIEDVYKTNIGD
jgi:hypothetical protein